MAITARQISIGAIVTTYTALIGAIGATVALYSQVTPLFLSKISRREFAPVGTVFSSYLDPVAFAKSIDEIEGDDITKRTWILADGRNVTGTVFAKLTNDPTVPDLRKMFLRGLDPKENRAPGAVEEYATALPHKDFTGITSQDGQHHHDNGLAFDGDKMPVGMGNADVSSYGPTKDAGLHKHSVTINGGGDDETRPKNVGLYYYIKVN
ncbi:hypothetical protein EN866_34510 [Mesorhizobium sp. M2D.F.Ca.ET.223.01.1.1]|uniref:hypothetical protein n=1 Tax=Mesorhizobium sp. M2D.F.Ca.ET.223.01.1.1 TaxID=2563940 RepID=UPI001091E389|nr:hypothetical protein [Mesorhizobium sp. M2D.F.Ca.ET.223.01.1.1]TGR83017.1 hypothetical protein EN866_34510 [Mesorhizobium sp. M2D.F.Ca.ET.223.01.1.1]TGT70851.1 hypothetical protein EN802_21280 [bacterium M00.F.Ca.ET.159.01.1.1]TGT82494.1 hypothetical protein EN800_19440 [bacterium M00.F.Ca.ET.157.01.1.1]